MKQSLRSQIEQLVEQLVSREEILKDSIAKNAKAENYTEAARLSTRLDVVKSLREELSQILLSS